MKKKLCQALILFYFDLNVFFFFETDASDYINAGVLSQEKENDILHLIVYFSKKMILAKYNYKIYEKKAVSYYSIIQAVET